MLSQTRKSDSLRSIVQRNNRASQAIPTNALLRALVALVLAAVGSLVAIVGTAAASEHRARAPFGKVTPVAKTPVVTVTAGLALSPPKVVFLSPFVAATEGFFAKEHLRIKEEYMPTGLEVELGTTAGAINFGLSSGTDPIEAAAEGAPVRAIGSYGEKLDTVCIVPKTIKSAKTLIGKPVGTTGATGFAYTTLNACLVAGGVKITEVHTITMTRAEFVSAIEDHKIYAASFHADTGYVVLHTLPGSHVLYKEYESDPTWWYGAISTKLAYARTHKSIVERFLAALALADRWMNTKKNTAKLITIGVKATGESRAAVNYAVHFEIASHTWSTTLALVPKRIDFTTEELLHLKEITHKPTYTEIVTTTYLTGALELLKEQGYATGYPGK
jgi:ABC-type nitrate/sulfonate/bicarbonate transport system substrate-binding protein